LIKILFLESFHINSTSIHLVEVYIRFSKSKVFLISLITKSLCPKRILIVSFFFVDTREKHLSNK